MTKDPGKHWSPKGKRGRPSYLRSEMDDAQNDSPLAVCEHYGSGVRVEMEYIGEGYNGDWDPFDPQDAPLVRFRVFDRTREEGDQELDSYCTQIPATMPVAMMESFACELATVLANEESWKHLLQQWSWADEASVKRIYEKRMKRAKKP